MHDELTNIITCYLVENQTEPLGIHAREIMRNTNISYIIGEHVRNMSDDIDRCIQQYVAKNSFAGIPAIPATVKYLEFDKSDGSYHPWGEEDFNLAFVLNCVRRTCDLDANDQDPLWCIHKAKDIALIHWDGCEFELDYDDEDWQNYYDWRVIDDTKRPLVTIATSPGKTTPSVIDSAIIFDHDICIELENIGEGINGDYNPNDPNDTELLRLTLYSRNTDSDTLEWSEQIGEYSLGLSTCTQIPTTCKREIVSDILHNVYDKIRYAIVHPDKSESLKHIVDAASWLSDTCTEIPQLR